MKSVGATPRTVTSTDDALMDLQALTMEQVENTEHTLADMDMAAKDGLITPNEWRHIKRHVATEHGMNRDATVSTSGLRTYFERFNALVTEYRARLENRRPVGAGR